MGRTADRVRYYSAEGRRSILSQTTQKRGRSFFTLLRQVTMGLLFLLTGGKALLFGIALFFFHVFVPLSEAPGLAICIWVIVLVVGIAYLMKEALRATK